MASSSYQQRIARYLAAHPGATQQEARGHRFTPEHGHVKHVAPGGPTTFETGRGADATRIVERLAANNPNQRVTVTVTYKDGRSVTYFRNPGHGRGGGIGAEYLARELRGRRFGRGLLNARGKTKYRVRRADAVARVQVQVSR